MFTKFLLVMALYFQRGAFRLVQETDCVCPGYPVTFQCVVVGRGSTVWQGTAFHCSNSDGSLTLRHSQFVNGTADKICEEGAVVARPLEVVENSTQSYYVSQLSLTVGLDTRNKSVQCAHDNGSEENVVGTTTVSITTEPYPPANDVHLVGVNELELNFSWSPPVNNCPALAYTIQATQCGVCPQSTNETHISCSREETASDTCLLSVQTEVCGTLVSDSSIPLKVAFIVPSVKSVKFAIISELNVILTIFNKSDPVNISDSVDGSATSYTITYSDTTSGNICSSATIIASSCIGACKHLLEISPLSCLSHDNFTVSVFATNVFGNGPLVKGVMISSNKESIMYADCDSNMTNVRHDVHFTPLFAGIASSIIVLLSVMLVASIIVIFILARAIIRMRKTAVVQESQTGTTVIYEQIDLQNYGLNIPTDSNVAYGNVSSSDAD